MKQKYKLLVPLLTIISIVGGFANFKVVSSADTKLYVDPPIVYALPGESFTIDIKVADVTNLHIWQVNLSFNPDVLKFVNVTEGDFLLKAGRETVGFTNLDKVEEGVVVFTWSILEKFSVSGSGTLATVKFQVLKEGESELKLVTVPFWRDNNNDGVVDVYKHDESFVKEMGFDKDWPDMRIVNEQKDAELTFPTTLIKMNPAPVPPGGTEQELLPYTAADGIFFNKVDPPVAEFTYSPPLPDVNETITFDASASSAATPLDIVEYQWDFDDGTTETYVKDVNLTDTITHTYTTGGTYNVTLTVIDNANATTLIEAMYNTTRMPQVWYDLYSTATKTIVIRLGHDIAITNVKASKEEVTAGETISINVTVLNKGTETESFNVTVYYGDNKIETKQVTDLNPGEEEILVFSWDTTGVAEGDYQIWAEATDVEGEGNPQDNKFTDGTVTVTSAEQTFPTTMVVGGAAAVAVLAIILFVYMRRRGSSPA
jgi:PKD repeat protein